jgi:hypothetical protein
MGQTLNGSLDLSSTNGFTPGKCDQTNGGWPANMAGPGGAWDTQKKEWIALMAKNGFPNADITNQNLLGKPIAVPQPIFNQTEPTPSPIVTTKNPDGSTASANGQIPNTSVVCNLPAKLA